MRGRTHSATEQPTFQARNGEPIAPARVAPWGEMGDSHVKKVEEYLEHASECRTLARAAPPAHRQQLEDMAQTWEQLAEARKRKIKKQFRANYVRHPSATN